MSAMFPEPPEVSLVRKVLTDRLWQSLLGVIVVFLITLAYLFNNVLDTPLIGGTQQIKVQMAATGGLFEGSSVTYRGVKVGKVQQIALDNNGVVATVVITSGDQIPVRSIAKVRSLSPVGEQYLDFQPQTSDGPFLKDGSVVPATSTDLPKTLASTVISVNKLLQQVNPDQLHTLLTELSTGLAGTGEDLGKLVDQGSVLLADLDRLWPETDRLLTNASTVLDIGPGQANEIRTLATSSKQFASFLKNYNPELRTMLHRAPDQITQLKALIADAQRALPGFLSEGVLVSDLFSAYAPHLGALLANYSPGLGVLVKSIKNGVLQVEGIPQRPVTCDYGTPRRDPKNPVRRPLVSSGHCPATKPNVQRGAAHAPGPVTQ